MTEREEQGGDEGQTADSTLPTDKLQAGPTPGSSPNWPADAPLGTVDTGTESDKLPTNRQQAGPTPGSEPGDVTDDSERGEREDVEVDPNVQRRPAARETDVQRKPEGHEPEVQRKPGT